MTEGIDQENQVGVSGPYSTANTSIENEELAKEIWQNCTKSRSIYSTWRTDAKEDYDYFAGNQWDETDKIILREQGRPAVTFNRVIRTINAITGLQIQTRQEAVCYPVEMGDAMQSEYQTNVLRYYRQKCDAQDEDSQAFQDAAICGMGWTETLLDTDDISDPTVIVNRIDPLEMLWDYKSNKTNIADANWIARVRDLTKKEFDDMFPDAEFESYSFWGGESPWGDQPHDATESWRYKNDQSEKEPQDKTCSVIQYQYWCKERYYKVQDVNGKMLDINEEQFNKIKKIVQLMKMPFVEYKRKIYKQCFILKKRILHESELKINAFSFKVITGYYDRNGNKYFGLVRLMKDPQMWANKWLSQIQHIVNSGAKNGLIVEEGALKNPRKVEESWSLPGSITVLNSGGLQKIMPKEAPRYPEGVDRLLQYAMASIEDVVGINLEMLGLANRDQPIGLEESRKKAAVTMLASFFDSLRKYNKDQARVMMAYIQEYIPEGTLVRIVGETGAQYIPLIKSQLSTKFDIVMDEAPNNPNIKERVSMALMQYVPMAMQAGIPIPPDILDYAMLPSSLVQKWKNMIMQSQQDSPEKQKAKQMQDAMMQIDIAQRQANLQKTSSETVNNYAKAEQAYAVSKDEAAQAMRKMDIHNDEMSMKYEAMLAEQRRKELEFLMNQRRKNVELSLKQMNSNTLL